MSTDELLEEQNRLLRATVKLLIQQNIDEDAEKAKLLDGLGFSHQEIANLIGKGRSTVTKYLS